MFGLLRNQSRSAAGAIMYVTIGSLLVIWAGLWYYYFLRPEPNPPTWQVFLCVGVILSGITVAVIGLLFGLIGRGAKAADTTVAVTPPAPVLPAMTAATTVTPNGVATPASPVVHPSAAVPTMVK